MIFGRQCPENISRIAVICASCLFRKPIRMFNSDGMGLHRIQLDV